MKGMKKLLLISTLILSCIVGKKLTVFAGELSTAAPLGDCLLTFSLTDKTNGMFSDELSITLQNIDTGLEYNYTMTGAEYLFGFTICGNVKQGSYSVAVSYPSKEQGQFIVQNADGTEISSFIADSTEHTFDWAVFRKEDTETPESEMLEAMEQHKSVVENYAVATGMDEADRLWTAFLEAVAPIEYDSQYSFILDFVHSKLTVDIYAEDYERLTGNSKEEYMDMAPFEQMLWLTTYILPDDKDISYSLFSDFGNSEMVEAYRALMDWDRQYLAEHGTVYNFMEGNTSYESDVLDKLPSEASSEDPSEPESKTPEEVKRPSKEESESGEEKTEKGIWDDTLNLFRNNALTIIILIVLLGATIAVVVYRKRKTIDDEII